MKSDKRVKRKSPKHPKAREVKRNVTERKRSEEAINTERQRFKTLSENTPFGMVMINKDGTFTYISPKFKELFGYDLNDVPNGKTWFKKAYPDTTYRHHVISTWVDDLKIINVGGSRPRIFTVTCKDGTKRIVNFTPVQLETGENLMTCDDVTEQKKTEKALLESEERFRSILENMQDGYFEVDLAGNFTYFNDSLCRMFGYPKEELMGMNNRQYMDKEDAKKVYQRFNQMYTTGEPHKVFDYDILRKDGTKRSFEVSVSLITDGNGERIGFRGVARDITERKRVAEVLRESEKRYRELFDNAPVGYHEYDTEGRITSVNRTELEMLGYTIDEMLGQPVWKFIVEEELSQRAVTKKLAGVVTPGKAIERAYQRKDGTSFPVLVEDRALQDEKGEVIGIRSTIQDITEHKRSEEALKKSEEKAQGFDQESAVMVEIGRIISSTLNINEVYERFAEEARKLIPFDRIMINLADLKNKTSTPAYIAGIDVPGRRAMDATPLAGTVTEEVIRTRSSLLIQVDNDNIDEVVSRFPPLLLTFQAGLRSIIFVPLISKDQVIGVLSFRATKPNAYSERDLGLAERIANQIAGAIANAELFDQLKKAEEVVRGSEEKYRALFEGSKDAVYITSREGEIIDFNQAFLDLLGYSYEDLKGVNATELYVNSADRDMFRKEIEQKGFVEDFEVKIRKKDATVIDCLKYSSVRMAKDGNILGYQGLIRDITERKRKEEEYRTILRTTMDGFWIVDMQGHFLDVNDAYCRLTGYSRDELLTMRIPDIEAVETLEETAHRIQKIKKTGGDRFETHHRCKDGRILDVEISVNYIDAGGGRLFVFTRDVTDRKRSEEAIKAERERFQALSENAPFGLVLIDENGIFKYVNPKFRELFGYDLDDVPDGKTWFKKAYPDTTYRHHVISTWVDDLKIIKVGGSRPRIFTVTSKDGTRKITHFIPVQLTTGENLMTFDDVTEQKKTEKALLESEERFRSILENMEDGYFEADLAGNFTYFNDSLCRMFGYPKEELMGMNNRQYMDKEDAKKVYQGFNRVYTTGEHQKIFDYNILRKDGTRRSFEASISLIRDVNGERIGFRAVVRDITERMRAEEALKQAEEKYRGIFENSVEGIFQVTSEGHFISVNPSFVHIHGYHSAEELINTVTPLGHQLFVDQNCCAEYAELLKTRGVIQNFEAQLNRKDGSVIWVQMNVRSVRDNNGRLLYYEGIVQDITERKRTEEEIRNYQEHLEELVRKRTEDLKKSSKAAMNLMQDANMEKQRAEQALKELSKWQEEVIKAKETAEAANRAKGTFLASMSHEIRTPMNAIIGLTHLALSTELTPKQMDYLKKIEGSSKFLLGAIDDILDFSKIEAGRLIIEHIPFNLNDVMDGLVGLSYLKAEQKGLELLLWMAPDVPYRLVGDPLRIGQILNNLTNNALKFTENGEIVVSVSVNEHLDHEVVLKFSVKDTGIGMTEEEQEKLFQAFTQSDGSITRKYGGTGLGLSISKRLLEMMGGKIWVTSEPRKGSTFTFILRCGLDTREQPKPVPLLDPRGMKVLIVDDNPTALDILREALKSMAFNVTAVASGQAALNALREEDQAGKPFHLVMLDWKMPEMDGIEVSKRIKEDLSLCLTPSILLVTAHGKEALIKEAKEVEIDGFLAKPVSPARLFSGIMTILEKGREWISGETEEKQEWVISKEIEGARVLLVEDNEINRQVAIELLEKAGIEVSVAVNGIEAIDKVEKGDFDAVLMDIQMPEMDGLTATQHIRRLDKGGIDRLPIIAMTAHAMSEDREKSLKVGMNDYMTKPIDPKKLFTVLMRWVKPREGTSVILPDRKPTAVERDIPEVPGIDTVSGLARVAGNKRLFLDLLRHFRENYTRTACEIEEALDTGDEEKAERLAHTVRGVAGNISAVTLCKKAQALETAIRTNDKGKTTEILKDFTAELDKIINALSTLEPEEVVSMEKALVSKQVDTTKLKPILIKLHRLLVDNDSEATDYLHDIWEDLCLAFKDPELSRFKKKTEIFMFDEAADLLRKMAADLNLSLEEML